jgi:hypothetical protein
MMLPAAAMPFHDTDGRWYAHLQRVTPQLRQLFEHVYLNITPPTRAALPDAVRQLQGDPLFRLSFSEAGSQVGDHGMGAYRHAAQECQEGQVIHLCYIDRLVFILQSRHRAVFSEDIASLKKDQAPVLFMRSQETWAAYPRNYYDCERMPTQAGELLFGRSLDFCWCHLAATAGQLAPVLPRIRSHDFGAQAELALYLMDRLTTREVAWLAWEDPSLEGRDAGGLKREREASAEETRKRLGYVVPILKLIRDYKR